MKLFRIVLPAMIILLAAGISHAQGYSIQWYSVNNGGGEVSSPSYTVKSSVGQGVAGVNTTPNLSHYIGYWGGLWGYAITGKVILEAYSADITLVPITVELRCYGGPTTVRTIFLDSDGNFLMSDVEPGTYDVAFKASHWLRKVVYGVLVGP